MSTRARAAAPARRRAATAPAHARPLEQPRPTRRPSSRTAAQPKRHVRVLVRWMWVPALAVMLGGIIWINAATLRLSTRSSLTIQRANEAQSEIINLNAALQQEDAQVRIAATRMLGMKQETSAQVTILRAVLPTR
jgi:hypothetical protein